MTPDLRFDFMADMQTGILTMRREFAAPRPLVWDCHTKSDLLDQWFAPKPMSTKTKSFEFREGGHWHYAMVDPSGTEYWGLVEYLSITPIERYRTRDHFADAEGVVNADLPGATWDVTFEDRETRSLVQSVITYASARDLQTVIDMGMKEGLASTLEKLDELLETLPERT